MAISSDYPRPTMVNGYVCRNCDDVSDAKKFIDPSKPKIGPGAVDAGGGLPGALKPASEPQAGGKDGQPRAVSFGGTLSFRDADSRAPLSPAVAGTGQLYDKVA